MTSPEKTYSSEDKKVLFEKIFWLLFTTIALARLLYIGYRYSFETVLIERFNGILFLFFIFLSPIIFRLVFGFYPFQLIRNKFINLKNEKEDIVKKNAQNELKGLETEKLNQNEFSYLSELSRDSKLIADKIFFRANWYLFIGILFALLGVFFFSFYSVNTFPKIIKSWLDIMPLIPRFGGLIFIELIAFFFLRQYRITMDEYRYFESIKRHRESNLAILLISKNMGDGKMDFEKLINRINLYANPDLIPKGDKSILNESKRISSEEYSILTALIEKLYKN